MENTVENINFLKELQNLCTKKGKEGMIIFGLFIIINILCYFYPIPDVGNNRLVGKILLTILLVIFFRAFYISYLMTNESRNPIIKDIKKNNDEIVWVYILRKIVYGAINYSIVYVTKDGKRRILRTDKIDLAENIILKLSNIFPKADLGYSKELEKKHKVSFIKRFF